MNKIKSFYSLKVFISAADKSLPKMHLRNHGFTYSAWEPFTKNKEKSRRFKIYLSKRNR